jgi:ABC-type transport system substrate-binding protein
LNIQFEKYTTRVWVILMPFLLWHCGQVTPEDRSKVFYYNESNAIASLDPAFAKDLETMWATNQLFDGLVELDSNLIPVPSIARRWEISADGCTYRFNLREDVYFHPSPAFSDDAQRKVTAHDFVYSFERIRQAEVASPGAWIFENVKKEHGFAAINDTVLEIYLTKPFQPFLGMLSTQYASVVPEEAIRHYGLDFRSHPVGTGPFQFAFWYEGIALVFHRFEKFWKYDQQGVRLPYLDAVKIDFVKDMSIEYQGLLNGRYDFMSGIHVSFKDELLTMDGELDPAFKQRLRFQKTPFIKTDYLGFMLDPAFLDPNQTAILDVRVRRAIDLAIDKSSMVKFLRNNTVIPAYNGFVPPVLLQENLQSNTYDPVRAAQLINETGFTPAQLQLSFYTTTDYADLLEYIQHALGRIGIQASVQVMQSANFKDQTNQAKLPIFRKSWLADYADAENFLGIFRSNRFAPGGPNYMRYQSASFDDLYEKATAETNDSLRLNLYRQMNAELLETLPVIPLYYDQVSHFVNADVHGLSTNAINMLDLSTVYKVPPTPIH